MIFFQDLKYPNFSLSRSSQFPFSPNNRSSTALIPKRIYSTTHNISKFPINISTNTTLIIQIAYFSSSHSFDIKRFAEIPQRSHRISIIHMRNQYFHDILPKYLNCKDNKHNL